MRMVVLTIAAVLLICTPAAAQKGTGEPTGVARQATKPTVKEYSGVVTDVEVGTCAHTTGRSVVGAHFMVRSGTDGTINLHLGPRDAVQPVIDAAPAGTPIMFEAFRTEAMPADAYVAKSVTVDGETMALRDDALRPGWARGPGGGGMGQGQGMGPGQGQGMGPGQGQGMGPGQGQGMGPGQGQGMGPGQGQGMGPGQGQGMMGQDQGPGSGRSPDAGMGPGSQAPGGGRNPCWWEQPQTGEQ